MSVPRRTTPPGALGSSARAVGSTLVVALLAAGCTAPSTPAAEPDRPATSSAPVSAYDAEGPLLSPRGPCTGLPAAALADALGGAVESSLTWAPGQRLPGTSDVADEYGCRITAGDVTASAWVFAVPTSPGQARRLAREATGPTCRRLDAVDTFGALGVAYTCDLEAGTSVTGMRGLVGTSWVSCEIRGTDDAEQVGRWCAAVLGSLSAP